MHPLFYPLCETPIMNMGGSATPPGRYGVRSRSRPSDQALRVLAASKTTSFLAELGWLALSADGGACRGLGSCEPNPLTFSLVPGTKLMPLRTSNSLSDKAAISCQARICGSRGRLLQSHCQIHFNSFKDLLFHLIPHSSKIRGMAVFDVLPCF